MLDMYLLTKRSLSEDTYLTFLKNIGFAKILQKYE